MSWTVEKALITQLFLLPVINPEVPIDLEMTGSWPEINNTQTSQSGFVSLLGGDPAAPSGTATLLRLHPSHQPHLRRPPPQGLE